MGATLTLAATALLVLCSATLSPTGAAAADLDCADFASQAEAQENLLPGDPYGLDGDSDGIACEDNPCPCSYESSAGGGDTTAPPAAPPKPPPYRLSKRLARAEAKRLGRKFVRRNPNVDALSFGGCSRLATRLIDCDLAARGSSATQRTVCQLRVRVRARDRHPDASLTFSNCQTKSSVRLRAGQAREVIRARAAELAGKPVGLLYVERQSPQRFVGAAEWAQISAGVREECAASIEAMLSPTRELNTSLLEFGCDVATFP